MSLETLAICAAQAKKSKYTLQPKLGYARRFVYVYIDGKLVQEERYILISKITHDATQRFRDRLHTLTKNLPFDEIQYVFNYIEYKFNITPADTLTIIIDRLQLDQCKQLICYITNRMRRLAKQQRRKLPNADNTLVSNEGVIIPPDAILQTSLVLNEHILEQLVPFKDTLVDHIWSIEAEPNDMAPIVKPIARLVQ